MIGVLAMARVAIGLAKTGAAKTVMCSTKVLIHSCVRREAVHAYYILFYNKIDMVDHDCMIGILYADHCLS